MKLKITGFALVALFATAYAGSLKSEVEASSVKVTAAIKAKDFAKFEKLTRPYVTKDFVHVENGRSMTYDQMLEEMKMGIGMMGKITVCTTKVLGVKESGNEGIAKVKHVMVGTMTGPDKKTHKMAFEGMSADRYRKVNGKWKMYKMEWSEQKMTMDGKPFDPSQMAPPQPVKKP